jgi:hypothetical protein
MGSKYNLAVVVVPCLLAIWLSPSRAKILAPSALLLSAAATFLVVAPYTLLDFRSFLNDFGSQIADYSRGEKASGFDWGRFTAYFGHVVGDYGWASALFAAAGLVFIARSDWKRSLGLSAFIVLLPWLMSSYPRLYSRNVLPLFALYAVLVAVGVVCLWPWAVAQCSRWRLRSIDPRILGISAGIAIAAIVVASLPWNKLVAAYDLSSDSRNLTVRWIKRNVPTGSTILVPKELLMNVGSLVPHYQVVVKPFDRLEAVPGSENLYLLVPSFGHRRPGGRSLAESCRQQAEVLGGTPLVTFGRKPVLVDYPRPAAYGNPVIQIRKLG